mmetsp:Transcript_147749/g.358599  ORF Transcript_147749/g.358599 Transcript_147749/m.358599 type:complete len:239 (-) Transcript_147749:170-886(-)
MREQPRVSVGSRGHVQVVNGTAQREAGAAGVAVGSLPSDVATVLRGQCCIGRETQKHLREESASGVVVRRNRVPTRGGSGVAERQPQLRDVPVRVRDHAPHLRHRRCGRPEAVRYSLLSVTSRNEHPATTVGLHVAVHFNLGVVARGGRDLVDPAHGAWVQHLDRLAVGVRDVGHNKLPVLEGDGALLELHKLLTQLFKFTKHGVERRRQGDAVDGDVAQAVNLEAAVGHAHNGAVAV